MFTVDLKFAVTVNIVNVCRRPQGHDTRTEVMSQSMENLKQITIGAAS